MRHAKKLLYIFLGAFSIFTGIAHASVTYKDEREGDFVTCEINESVDLTEDQSAGIFWILQDKSRRAYSGAELLHISSNNNYYDHTLRNTIVTYESKIPTKNWSGNFKGYVTASFDYYVTTTCSKYKQILAEADTLGQSGLGRRLLQKGLMPSWASAGIGVATGLAAGILFEATLPATASVATVIAVKCFAGVAGGGLSAWLSGQSELDITGSAIVGCIGSSVSPALKVEAVKQIQKALPALKQSFDSTLMAASQRALGFDFGIGFGNAIVASTRI